jgi:hypothetical protein
MLRVATFNAPFLEEENHLMKSLLIMALAAPLCLFAISCSRDEAPAPSQTFLDRPVFSPDPGWYKGLNQDMGVELEGFIQALAGEKTWESVEGGGWVLRVEGALPGSGDKALTIYTFEKATGSEGQDVALLSKVDRGTKRFTAKEIWGLAIDRAKAAKKQEGEN